MELKAQLHDIVHILVGLALILNGIESRADLAPDQ